MDESVRAALTVLAANIRRHRRAGALTQAQLAERVGVEPRFVQSIEAATDAPGFATLVAIANALDVKLRDLFEPAEPAQRNPGRPPKRDT